MGFGFDGIGGVISSVWNTAVDTPINNALSISAAQRNQRYAREQMAWQEKMSNTAHQREIADLRAAGLNPILTATGGNGASTPNGQSGSIAQAQAEGFDASSAKDLIKYFDSQKENTEADTAVKKEQKKTEKAAQKKLKQETLESASRTGLNNNQYNYDILTMPSLAETVNSSNAVKRLENQFLTDKYNDEKEFYRTPTGGFVRGASMVTNAFAPFLNSAVQMSRPPANIQNLRSYSPTFHNYGRK